MNYILGNGNFPFIFVVQPLLKKPKVDPTVLNKFRPIATLLFDPYTSQKLPSLRTQITLFEQLTEERAHHANSLGLWWTSAAVAQV